jgi:ATP phosphoribosyltransferase regulatory subunit HisZ
VELNSIWGTGEFAFGDAVVLLLKVVAVYRSIVAAVGLAPDAEAILTGFISRKSMSGVSS